MDLHTVDSWRTPCTRAELGLAPGEALLAGGSWLFSEPQQAVTGLVDLTAMGWPPWTIHDGGLSVSATCTIAQLLEPPAPADWAAAPLFRQCAEAFLMSFKIWNTATVGGNLCLALPAGAMISLATALDAEVVVWTPDGGQRREQIVSFVRGVRSTSLRPGEILRSIEFDRAALRGRTAFRKFALTPLGRSSSVVTGRLDADGRITLAVTAATPRPQVFHFGQAPTDDAVQRALATVGEWYDDAHGTAVAGLGAPERLHAVQQRFIDAAGFQCGFCTAGMIVTASTLEDITADDLPRVMKGNLCRCTGYRSIRDAIAGTVNTAAPAAGEAFGSSVAAPAGRRIVTGREHYALDEPATDLLHLAVLGSPHAHARIVAIDVRRALAVEGVQLVLTHEDVPDILFSTGRHENRLDDPDDTRILDPVLRFRGQRVAAVVADSVAAAEHACRLIDVKYEVLPAVFDPHEARRPGAPLVHGDKDPDVARISEPGRNVVAQMHAEIGDVESALASAHATVSGTWQTARVTHASLETHGARAWIAEDGTLVVRTSSQVPFLVRTELARIFDLPVERVRVVVGRVGGGFGGKQELIVEDLVALATLRTGRAVQYELTREDQFTIVPCRHPMTVSIALGATADGTLTAMRVDVVTDTGAYGNHGPGVMFHGCHESVAVYRCANKRVDAEAVYTHNLPSGAFRGYGLGQVIFAIESAMDELARELGIDAIELRRRNVIVPGDPMVVASIEDSDLTYGSYGLDQCLDLVESALASGRGEDAPEGWPVGTGAALAMIATIPPRGHHSQVAVSVSPDGIYTVDVGTAEFGNGTTTVHVQLIAQELATSPDRVRVRQSDTATSGYDTGAYGSTGSVVAGKAVQIAAERLRAALLDRAGGGVLGPDGVTCDGIVLPFSELVDGILSADGSHDGTPRSIAFNVHGFRVAVDPATGEVRILQSVQAVDAGVVINPEQLRGQVEGGTAQGIGSALYEEMMLRDGEVLTRTFRDYRVPQMADIPPTEVLFADTVDGLGPRGAKSMSEAPYNPVAPALANAIRDAVGVRPHELPMSRDRLWRLLNP